AVGFKHAHYYIWRSGPALDLNNYRYGWAIIQGRVVLNGNQRVIARRKCAEREVGSAVAIRCSGRTVYRLCGCSLRSLSMVKLENVVIDREARGRRGGKLNDNFTLVLRITRRGVQFRHKG